MVNLFSNTSKNKFLVTWRRFQNPVKYLRWVFLQKELTTCCTCTRIYRKIAPCDVHLMAFWNITALKLSGILKKTHAWESLLKVSGCSVAKKATLSRIIFKKFSASFKSNYFEEEFISSYFPQKNWTLVKYFDYPLTLRNLLFLWLHGTIIRMYYSSMMVAIITNFLKLQPISEN